MNRCAVCSSTTGGAIGSSMGGAACAQEGCAFEFAADAIELETEEDEDAQIPE